MKTFSEENAERVLFEGLGGPRSYVARKAHLQGDALLLHIAVKISAAIHVLHQAGSVSDSVRPAFEYGLADGFAAVGLTCVDGHSEPAFLCIAESFQVHRRRIALFRSGDVEAHDPVFPVPCGQLRDFQARGCALVSHGTQQDAPFHPGFLLSPGHSGRYRTHDLVKRKPFLRMQYGCEADFPVDDVLGLPVQDGFVCDSFQRLARLHHRSRDGEGLQVKRQAFEPAAAVEPGGELRRVMGRDILGVSVCKFYYRPGPEPSVQVVVKLDLGQFPDCIFCDHGVFPYAVPFGIITRPDDPEKEVLSCFRLFCSAAGRSVLYSNMPF